MVQAELKWLQINDTDEGRGFQLFLGGNCYIHYYVLRFFLALLNKSQQKKKSSITQISSIRLKWIRARFFFGRTLGVADFFIKNKKN